MTWVTILLIVLGVALVAAFLYWQLIVAEGAYLGQPLVTWLYDITAPRYENIKQFDRFFENRFLGQPLAAALRNRRAALVLDIATGSGRLPLTLLAQQSFQGRIVGVDASRPMLAQAAHNLSGFSRVHLIWRDARSLPFPDGTFDAVTILEMLEFTPDPVRQLREAVRVLRPGGVLMTTRRRGFDAALMPGKTHSPELFKEILEKLGLELVTIDIWQMDYDLVWGWRPGDSGGGARPLVEFLLCPSCQAAALVEAETHLHCEQCGKNYPISDSIIDLHI